MKRLSFWEIFQNTDLRAPNCQTVDCPKFTSGESQKLHKFNTKLANLWIHKKREKNDYVVY